MSMTQAQLRWTGVLLAGRWAAMSADCNPGEVVVLFAPGISSKYDGFSAGTDSWKSS